jgi:hypothetical protein
LRAVGGPQRERHVGCVDLRRDFRIEFFAHQHEQPTAISIQDALDHVREQGDKGEADQGFKTLAAQDAVIDLHHEQGAGQRQDVDEAT